MAKRPSLSWIGYVVVIVQLRGVQTPSTNISPVAQIFKVLDKGGWQGCVGEHEGLWGEVSRADESASITHRACWDMLGVVGLRNKKQPQEVLVRKHGPDFIHEFLVFETENSIRE